MSPERQTPVPIEEEMRKSYLDYAMSVIVGRALPDIRDGLKPVHRRVLFAMSELGLTWNRAYKKAARVVGEVLGKYHPHGDAPVYEALVRMVQEFSLRYPLVDGQGNFGSIDGDPPAAMRYTEARLAKIAHELLADIEKETVDHSPNFDESLQEPTVLPTKVPNLLVNGSSGIAVGMATNIPPHNLSEVVDGLVMLVDDPDVSIATLMTAIPGPDFPTAAYIYGRNGIREAYTTGRGILTLRAKAHAEKLRGGREAIIVTELPYQINKATLIEKIGELIRDKKIEGISERRDESGGLHRCWGGEIPQIVMNQLTSTRRCSPPSAYCWRWWGAAQVVTSSNAPGVRRLPPGGGDAADALAWRAEGGPTPRGLKPSTPWTWSSPSFAPTRRPATVLRRPDLWEIQAKAILDMRLHGSQQTALESTRTLALIADLRGSSPPTAPDGHHQASLLEGRVRGRLPH